MKNISTILFIFFLFLNCNLYAQQTVKVSGKVLDEKTNESLPYVSVYINNTTKGTTTNQDGEFKLDLAPGKYQLIVSFTGYEPVVKELIVEKVVQPYVFRLKGKASELQEISITAKTKNLSRAHLKLFQEQFLGKSGVAQKCKILNPEVLLGSLDPETSVLQIRAKDFLLIENQALGYRIKYLLSSFKFNTKEQYVSYLGYASYEPLKGNHTQEYRWDQNRQKAYKGSVMHFVRTLRSQKLEEEGFYLRKLNKIPNPDRPTEAELVVAQTQIQRGSLEFGLNTGAEEVLKRAKLPAYVYALDTTRVPYSEFLAVRGEEVKMAFPGFFYVIYNREKEELAYTLLRSNYHNYQQAYQGSSLRLLGKAVTLEPAGNFTSPLDIFLDGYWAWEKTGDMLPLDYKAEEQTATPPQDELVAAISKPLEQFKTSHAQEKVYLHMDKPYYVAGEDIWYKAYLVNGLMHTPDSVSRNIYVELLSPTGQTIKRNIMKVKAGVAAGDFSMEDTLTAGTYTLRAYTNWMRNFSPEYFFTKEINIWNDKKSERSSKTAASSSPAPVLTASTSETTALPPVLEVQFFPESGYLVSGIESKVGFKAINSAGKGENISGTIVDENGIEITRFRSLHQGMGSFLLKPEAGKTYTARIQTLAGKNSSKVLPAIQTKGYVLQVNNSEEDIIQVTLNQSAKNSLTLDLILLAQVRGQVLFNTRLKANKQSQQVIIPKINMPSGVAQLTLFDAANSEPICERLVFINKKDNLQVSIQADKQHYLPREKVQLNIAVTDAEGNPVQTDLSLAVTDAKIEPEAYSQNLNTYLLLTSDLQGNIEQPGYYFKDNEAETQQALDNLLLTQGWRRFVWKDLVANKLPEIKFSTERHLSLAGQIKQISKDKPVANGKVLLTFIDADMQIVPTFTDQEGYFALKNLDFEGNPNVLLQAETNKGNERTVITLSEATFPVFHPKPLLSPNVATTQVTPLQQNYINQAKAQQKIADTYFYDKNTIVLQEVNVKSKRVEMKAPAIYGSPSRIIKVDKSMERFRNILTALEGKDIALGIKYPPVQSGSDTEISEANADSGGGIFTVGNEAEPVVTLRGKPVLVLVDGFRVYDFNIINNISPIDVESVEIVKDAGGVALGTEAYNGVLAINLKKGNGGRSQVREGSLSLKLPGYHKVREFYVSQYDVKKEEHSLPDKRSTLYWNPAVRTDASGKATVNFYNADDVAAMQATLEGVSNGGLVGSQTTIIK